MSEAVAETGTQQAARAPQDATQPAAAPATTTAAESAPETPEARAERLEAEVKRLRNENAQRRVANKDPEALRAEARAEIAREIAKALGQADDGQQADPSKLIQQVTDLTGETRTLRTQNAAILRATAAGADPVSLLDSNIFLRSLQGLDAADVEGIDAAIKAAVESNPRLRAQVAPPVPRSGPEMTGGTGEGGITQQQFDHMTVGERTALFESDRATYDRLSNRR